MTSGVPWHMRGVRPEVIDTAREAARRSGMSVDEWLDTVIAESARNAGIDPARNGCPISTTAAPAQISRDARRWRRDPTIASARRELELLATSARASTRSPARSTT